MPKPVIAREDSESRASHHGSPENHAARGPFVPVVEAWQASTRQIATLRHEDGELRRLYQGLGEHHAKLEALYRELSDQYAQLGGCHDELSADYAELYEQHVDLHDRHVELHGHHTELSERHTELARRHAELERALSDRQQALSHSQETLRAILASRSWRVFAPLRRLADRLRGAPSKDRRGDRS